MSSALGRCARWVASSTSSAVFRSATISRSDLRSDVVLPVGGHVRCKAGKTGTAQRMAQQKVKVAHRPALQPRNNQQLAACSLVQQLDAAQVDNSLQSKQVTDAFPGDAVQVMSFCVVYERVIFSDLQAPFFLVVLPMWSSSLYGYTSEGGRCSATSDCGGGSAFL